MEMTAYERVKIARANGRPTALDNILSIFEDFFELHGDTVWGATAAMLRQLLGLLTGTLARGDLDHE